MSVDAELLGWCVCANISDHIRGGLDPDKFYQGTKMYSPGTKVYLGSAYWGMGGRKMHVIGLRRISKSLVNCVIHIGIMENFRTVSVYSKARWAKLELLNAELFTAEEDAAKYLARCMGTLEDEIPDKLKPEIRSGPWGPYEVDRYRQQ